MTSGLLEMKNLSYSFSTGVQGGSSASEYFPFSPVDFNRNDRADLHRPPLTSSTNEKPYKVIVSPATSASFEERVFDSLVGLKVSASQFAMHMSREERARLFHDLDEKLNDESWYDDDPFPSVRSFQCFLRWTIFDNKFDWSSLGFSDEGHTLVAWVWEDSVLTGHFQEDENVRWTAKIKSPFGSEIAAGKSSLVFFSRQAEFYRSGTADAREKHT